MHNHHNNKEAGHKGMMWWMMIPCLLLLGVLFLGGSKLSLGEYLWPILIGVFVVAHIWMMFKGHGGHSDDNTENKINNTSAKQPETNLPAVTSTAQAGDENNKHKHGGSCH